jgi:uncharacterized DUF497 family protein
MTVSFWVGFVAVTTVLPMLDRSSHLGRGIFREFLDAVVYSRRMNMRFEWDEGRAGQNVEKHGVSFQEAAIVFGDPLSLTIDDPSHSQEEQRFVTAGESAGREPLVVIHADREDAIRIISARKATRRERGDYEQR